MRTKLLVASCLILTVILGCSSDSITDSQTAGSKSDKISKISPGEFSNSPFTLETNAAEFTNEMINRDIEFYQLARWLSGEMYAPLALVKDLKDELTLIRDQFGHSIPACKIKFSPIYEEGRIVVGFTDEGWDIYKAGNYNHWDSLNEEYNLISIEERVYSNTGKYVFLTFNGKPNIRLLPHLYRDLPELRYVEGNGICCDWPLLLLTRQDGVSHYFFRDAWGDCPAGCINWEYYYFTVENSDVQYKGEYKNYFPYSKPAWVLKAENVKASYWEY